MTRLLARATLVLLCCSSFTSLSAETPADAAASGRSAGTISREGGVKSGPAGDDRHKQTTDTAGPETGTSGKNADNNAPLAGPKRKSADGERNAATGRK